MASVLQARPLVDPIAEVLEHFGERRVTFENTFFKFNVPERGMALLVDFTTRRRQRRRVIELRATFFGPSGAASHVASYPLSALRHEADGSITIGTNWLGPTGSRGAIGPVSWDLVFQSSGPLVDPQVGGAIRPFDLRVRSVPDALLSGSFSIEHHGYSFANEPGTIGLYYGRRLPDHWIYLSANAFETAGVSLECVMLRSSIFGLPILRTHVGYFHLHTPEINLTLLHPLTGKIRQVGDKHSLQITARSHQSDPITIHFYAPEARFHHLGDRLFATLLGTCHIEGIAVADGTAGLTERKVN